MPDTVRVSPYLTIYVRLLRRRDKCRGKLSIVLFLQMDDGEMTEVTTASVNPLSPQVPPSLSPPPQPPPVTPSQSKSIMTQPSPALLTLSLEKNVNKQPLYRTYSIA